MSKNPIANASWMILAVIITAMSGWYYVRSDNPYILDNQTLKNMPDVIAQKVHLIEYDENGQIKHEMFSESMTHKPADDRYLFVEPKIRTFGDNQKSPWHITAKRAISTNGGDIIELIDEVHLRQRTDIDKFNDIITERLYYKPNTKFAYTDKPIEFSQPGTVIKSIGMQAELDSKHVKLLSRAQGAFSHANA